MHITDGEMGRMSSENGMTIGNAASGSITVNGMTDANTDTIGVLTLLATKAARTVSFLTGASSFNKAVIVQAAKGVDFTVDATANTGYMSINGDSNDSSDSLDKIDLTDGRTLTADTILTLAAHTSGLVPAGKATLKAKEGIQMLCSLTNAAAAKALIIDADMDADHTGTLTVATGRTITSTKSDIQITAYDLDLAGTAAIDAGTLSMTIHGGYPSQTIGLGAAPSAGNMHITDGEVSRMSCENGLEIGSADSGSVAVNAMTAASTDNIGDLTLLATKAAATISFETGASSFDKAINVPAAKGVD
jgi:hypothetical protein